MLTIIAAVARNGVIGKKNSLPWYFKEDLDRFKKLTEGHPLIMGWNTFISILMQFQKRSGSAKLLPGRMHYVLTSKSDDEIKEQLTEMFPEFDLEANKESVFFTKSFGNALQRAEAQDAQVFAIGGEKVFEDAMKVAGAMELTEIFEDYEGDAYFPKFSEMDWEKVNSEPHEQFAFVTYKYRRT